MGIEKIELSKGIILSQSMREDQVLIRDRERGSMRSCVPWRLWASKK
jgi:hypothetical protein